VHTIPPQLPFLRCLDHLSKSMSHGSSISKKRHYSIYPKAKADPVDILLAS
jgi:hypothetical protein